MSIQRQTCPFHSDEDIVGNRSSDGTYTFTCDRTTGHPAGGDFSWLHDPILETARGLGGLAEELGLEVELVEALRSLGTGWFEYGLVERAYADARPEDFRVMVDRWGHTAIKPEKYSCSSYIAGVLGRLARAGVIGYHDGIGTGRWNYNSNLSHWSIDPGAAWGDPTSWVSVIGDDSSQAREADLECKRYVLGELPS